MHNGVMVDAAAGVNVGFDVVVHSTSNDPILILEMLGSPAKNAPWTLKRAFDRIITATKKPLEECHGSMS